MSKRIDLTGKTFGDLKVIRLSDQRDRYNNPLWECLCVCGEIAHVTTGSLNAGHYKSCGCMRVKNRNKGVLNHIAADRVGGTRKTALKAKLHKNNKSRHKGVIWVESRQEWKAYIGFQGKNITLGYRKNREEAIILRKEAEEKYHKPYLEDSHDETN